MVLTVHLLCSLLFSELVMLLEWWSGTDCTLYTDQATVDKFGKEHVIVILNHNFEIDFLCGWTMCERFGVLGVSKCFKTCLKKDSIQHLTLSQQFCLIFTSALSVEARLDFNCENHNLIIKNTRVLLL